MKKVCKRNGEHNELEQQGYNVRDRNSRGKRICHRADSDVFFFSNQSFCYTAYMPQLVHLVSIPLGPNDRHHLVDQQMRPTMKVSMGVLVRHAAGG